MDDMAPFVFLQLAKIIKFLPLIHEFYSLLSNISLSCYVPLY